MDEMALYRSFFITTCAFFVTCIIHKFKVKAVYTYILAFGYLIIVYITVFVIRLSFGWSIVTCLGTVLVHFITINNTISQKLFTYTSSVLFMSIINSLSVRLQQLFGIPYIHLFIILSLIYLVIVVKSLSHEVRYVYTISRNLRWYLYSVYPVFGVIFSIVSPHYIDSIHYVYANILMIIVNLVAIYLYHILFSSIKKTHQHLLVVEQNTEMKRFVERQNAYHTQIMNMYDELKYFKHNINYHIQVLRSFTIKQDLASVHAYIERMNNEVNKISFRVFHICENEYINCILSSYLQQAEQNGICVKTNVALEKDLPYDVFDLCSIFGNCIENSIEACLRLESLCEKEIIVNAILHNTSLIVQFINSCDNVEFVKNEYYPRSRKENGGVGLRSIKYIVEKYKGDMDFSVSNNKFSILIRLEALPNDAEPIWLN